MVRIKSNKDYRKQHDIKKFHLNPLFNGPPLRVMSMRNLKTKSKTKSIKLRMLEVKIVMEWLYKVP